MKPNIQVWGIEKLIPYAQNAKIHDDVQVDRIAESIKRFGWNQPISVDQDGVIIAGHGRRLAALKLGQEQVPVWVRDDLTPEQVRALRLADNRVAEGSIDTAMFRKELEDLNFDLAGIFDLKELDFSTADLGEIVTDAFVADLDAAVVEQSREMRDRVETITNKPIPLVKLFGFRDVAGANQLMMTRFIAWIEYQTGLQGEAALIEHARACLEGSE